MSNLNTEQGYVYFKYKEKAIGLVNIKGRVFLNNELDWPSKIVDKSIEEIKSDCIF